LSDERDFLKYFDDERYLLEEVGPRFRKSGEIDAADFYMMLIWKANRAKNHHLKRLKSMVPSGVFQDAVNRIATALSQNSEQKARLRVLMVEWEFRLPTATAILTLLYPEEFTVYDYRVRDGVGFPRNLSYRTFSDRLWSDYVDFREMVEAGSPRGLSLRDKDRYLSGRSFRLQAERDSRA